MKLDDILFVSDLDGTLLDPDAALPYGVREEINSLISSGADITFATARTIRSAEKILDGINFTSPVALMNGVLIRDMNAGKYLKTNVLTQGNEILSILLENNIKPLVYSVDRDDDLVTAYETLYNDFMVSFVEERKNKYSKPFKILDDIHSALSNPDWTPIYIVAIDTYDALKDCVGKIQQLSDSSCTFYKNAFGREVWYLESFSDKASKGGAIDFLREYTRKKTIIAFGDNHNDLPMLEHADIAVVVEGAPEDVKSAADYICKGPLEHGVTEFIRDFINKL